MKIQDIKLDLNAICEFEKLTGKTLHGFLEQKTPAMNDIRGLIAAGLKIEEEKAGEMLQEFLNDDTQKETIFEIIERKIEETMPTKKKETKTKPKKK